MSGKQTFPSQRNISYSYHHNSIDGLESEDKTSQRAPESSIVSKASHNNYSAYLGPVNNIGSELHNLTPKEHFSIHVLEKRLPEDSFEKIAQCIGQARFEQNVRYLEQGLHDKLISVFHTPFTADQVRDVLAEKPALSPRSLSYSGLCEDVLADMSKEEGRTRYGRIWHRLTYLAAGEHDASMNNARVRHVALQLRFSWDIWCANTNGVRE
ncbi:MAG: hypothetical protein Q9202_005416 [Teloschistes flavicans]